MYKFTNIPPPISEVAQYICVVYYTVAANAHFSALERKALYKIIMNSAVFSIDRFCHTLQYFNLLFLNHGIKSSVQCTEQNRTILKFLLK